MHTCPVTEPTASSLLDDAADELYALDPGDFTARRTALSKAARTAGEKAAATEIAALRKPTQSAAVINRLARTDPAVIADLLRLGTELQNAQRAADGERLRELTSRRRQLVATARSRAFDIVGRPQPSAALDAEVTATLTAALADPAVATLLQHGILVRAAEPNGFGFSAPGALNRAFHTAHCDVAARSGVADRSSARGSRRRGRGWRRAAGRATAPSRRAGEPRGPAIVRGPGGCREGRLRRRRGGRGGGGVAGADHPPATGAHRCPPPIGGAPTPSQTGDYCAAEGAGSCPPRGTRTHDVHAERPVGLMEGPAPDGREHRISTFAALLQRLNNGLRGRWSLLVRRSEGRRVSP